MMRCWMSVVLVVLAWTPLGAAWIGGGGSPQRQRWVANGSTSLRGLHNHKMTRANHCAMFSCQEETNKNGSNNSCAFKIQSRRELLLRQTTTAMATLFVLPLAAHADSKPSLSAATLDPLDQLGQSLSTLPSSSSSSSLPPVQPQHWPNSESPLSPTLRNNNSSSQQTVPQQSSDLEQALQGMQKKRQIDPRTHG